MKLKNIRCILPPPTWTKANTDGASRGNPGRVGRGFFCNGRGFCKGYFAMYVGTKTTFVAEACTFIKTIVGMYKN